MNRHRTIGLVRSLIMTVLLMTWIGSPCAFAKSEATKPNIIVVVVDDVHVTQVDTGLGKKDGYPYPLPVTSTPTLKAFVQSGMPVKEQWKTCSQTRQELKSIRLTATTFALILVAASVTSSITPK